MLTRRGFLKGLLSSVAAGALIKNGVIRPEQVIANPKVFDMAENTWRGEYVTSMATVWDGHIGHFAVWDRLLTSAEIRKLSAWPSPLTVWNTYERAVLKSAPICYWLLPECRNGIAVVNVPPLVVRA